MPSKKKARKSTNVTTLDSKINQLSSKIGSLSMAKSKSQKKRTRKGNSSKSMDWSYPGNPISKASDTGLRRLRLSPRTGLSDAGVAFLKCAFAPPDFAVTSAVGVPDDFRGMSLTRKHRYVAPFSFTNSNDYYILLLPTPGVAYWSTFVGAGVPLTSTIVFTPTFYSDFPGMFGNSPATVSSQVTKFRFVSNHIEVIPTVNQMTWSGSITAWKMPITVIARPSGIANNTDMYTVNGLQGCNSNLTNQYSGPFIMGAYAACYSSNPIFPFQPLLENTQNIPSTLGSSDFGTLSLIPSGNGFPGLDNEFESLLVKVTGVTANESCLLKTWACVEYQMATNSTLYEFQSLSPCDKIAMELYREIILGLPVGVPFEQNESFWNRVLQIIHQISGAGAFLPGPYGAASRGVNLLSGAAMSLM